MQNCSTVVVQNPPTLSKRDFFMDSPLPIPSYPSNPGFGIVIVSVKAFKIKRDEVIINDCILKHVQCQKKGR